ncbi:MAG: hypothetical protein HQL74_05995 [Magnetococcales bacterium]|nr:hypothetical protein [Magnetococcales bacterium]
MSESLSLEEFKKRLRDASWFYMMADSLRLEREEKAQLDALREIANKRGDAWKVAYNDEFRRNYERLGNLSLPFPEAGMSQSCV